MKTIDEQIAAAKRELEMRKRIYPRWIANGKMTEAKAEHEIQCMESIIATLENLQMSKAEKNNANREPILKAVFTPLERRE